MKRTILSVAIFLAAVAPVSAEGTGLTKEQMQNCVDRIHEFRQVKHREEMEIITKYTGRQKARSRDLAVSSAQYIVNSAYINTVKQCGGKHNLSAIAYTMYRHDNLSTPVIDEQLSVK